MTPLGPLPPGQPERRCTPLGPGLGRLLAITVLCSQPALAGVQFVNCSRGTDGSISCDTVPTGNTLMNDVDARYGLLQQASPGWNEFDPYAGYNEDFGGNDL
ncbi:MAG: lactate dehydrogenase [Cyanobacteriota bacterium]|nr:lactate dehydrogenase [Cyanobacteriota bacterium]